MPKTRRTWREKLEKAQMAKVVATPGGRMLIPKALDVDALIRQIQRGKLATIEQIRLRLAKDSCAGYTCPLVTGIFLRICAETAEEDRKKGIRNITPYWRVVKADGTLNGKFPGGAEAQAALLREEGHTIKAGNRKKLPRVTEFEDSLESP